MTLNKVEYLLTEVAVQPRRIKNKQIFARETLC